MRLVRIGMGKSPFAGGQGIGWEFEFILAAVALALLELARAASRSIRSWGSDNAQS